MILTLTRWLWFLCQEFLSVAFIANPGKTGSLRCQTSTDNLCVNKALVSERLRQADQSLRLSSLESSINLLRIVCNFFSNDFDGSTEINPKPLAPLSETTYP